MQDWALAYAALGFRLLPLWPGEKRPLYDNWPNDATTDPELLGRYFRDPSRNMGVVCGEAFDAWDIEQPHIKKFLDWIGANGWTLPEAPIQQTGSGGWHILTEPTGVNGNRYLYLDGSHIGELKSAGGFIVLSPSKLSAPKNGADGQYRWTWAPEHLSVPRAPEWLLGLLERPKTAPRKFPSRDTSVESAIRRLEGLAQAVRDAGEGKRNNYLYWAMRRALEEGIPARYAGAELLQTGLAIGLTDHEAKATLRSAYEAEGYV